jgi:hypothetical protein
LQTCTGAGAYTSYCTGSNNGVLIADTTGTLHVCMNGAEARYPQTCINIFCSFDSTVYPPATGNTTGSPPCSTTSSPNYLPICPSGFSRVASFTDQFQTSPHTYVISVACCSN